MVDAQERVAELEAALRDAEWVLENHGFKRCDIGACNCGSWHQVGGFKARFEEIKDVVEEAGYSTNGRTLLAAVQQMAADVAKALSASPVSDRDAGRDAGLEEAARNAASKPYVRITQRMLEAGMKSLAQKGSDPSVVAADVFNAMLTAYPKDEFTSPSAGEREALTSNHVALEPVTIKTTPPASEAVERVATAWLVYADLRGVPHQDEYVDGGATFDLVTKAWAELNASIVALTRASTPASGDLEEKIARIEELETVCNELYQVIGTLSDHCGAFEHPDVIKALDNASDNALTHKDLLPWPKEPLPAAAVPEWRPSDFEIRKPDGEAIDEIVSKVALNLHIEQLADADWYLGFDTPNGIGHQFWFGAKNPKVKVTVKHTDSYPDASPLHADKGK